MEYKGFLALLSDEQLELLFNLDIDEVFTCRYEEDICNESDDENNINIKEE